MTPRLAYVYRCWWNDMSFDSLRDHHLTWGPTAGQRADTVGSGQLLPLLSSSVCGQCISPMSVCAVALKPIIVYQTSECWI